MHMHHPELGLQDPLKMCQHMEQRRGIRASADTDDHPVPASDHVVTSDLPSDFILYLQHRYDPKLSYKNRPPHQLWSGGLSDIHYRMTAPQIRDASHPL